MDDAEDRTHVSTVWMKDPRLVAREELIARIRAQCERHAHPGVNTGAHTLARAILNLMEEHNDGQEVHVQGTR